MDWWEVFTSWNNALLDSSWLGDLIWEKISHATFSSKLWSFLCGFTSSQLLSPVLRWAGQTLWLCDGVCAAAFINTFWFLCRFMLKWYIRRGIQVVMSLFFQSVSSFRSKVDDAVYLCRKINIGWCGTELDWGDACLPVNSPVQACRCWPRPHITGLSMPWMGSTICGTRLETDQVMLTEAT